MTQPHLTEGVASPCEGDHIPLKKRRGRYRVESKIRDVAPGQLPPVGGVEIAHVIHSCSGEELAQEAC